MTHKLTVLLGIFLAGSFLGQQAFAQKLASGFVLIPDDIHCSIQGMIFAGNEAVNGGEFSPSSVDEVTCSMSGKSPEVKKAIPLASTTISGGMLPTKEFGNLQIAGSNPGTLSMAISSHKLQLLRQYLQR
jgi:hypothetical protein